ncbi:MAG: recombinase family protein, partial [Syntrophomonadaceae bacterium]|nr:recombinase family protein [Syntrophomonadaceae bacterium]
MRAAVYARVSTEEQAQHGYSLAEQKDSCTQRAKELGATEVLVFADEGISGATMDRPGLEGLRDVIREGIIDLIVLRDPDRLSRKLAHQLILTEEFEQAEVRLEFLDFTWQDSPEGKLFYNLKGAVAEYEREKIKERMVRGKNQKARQGGMPMNFSLYGYDYSPEKGVQINKQEAPIVEQIFHKFVSYISPHAIAIELTQGGIPTKKNTNFWHRQVVRQILMNSAYKGEWVYQKNSENPIIIPVPAIISPEVWETAQQILAESRRLWAKKGKQQYLLSGLITCTDCGTPMGGHYGNHWNRKFRHYTCRKSKSTNRIPGCIPAKLINAESLELIVWSEVKNLLADPDKLVSAVKKKIPTDADSKKD